jgi:phenylacetate-CoA ligase
MAALNRTFERWFRARAYALLAVRDGQRGWQQGLREFRRDRSANPERLHEAVEQRLGKVLSHAFETTRYYREAWSSIGFEPRSFRSSADVERLPFVTKDIIRSSRDAMKSAKFGADELRLSYTGGTTGTQTAFYLDHECAVRRVGRQWGALESAGYEPGMRRALVWGVHTDVADPSAVKTLKHRFRHYATADAVLCCTVMDEPGMRAYHKQLLHFRPEVVYGYPSALGQLAQFIENEDLEPIAVTRTFTTAERLTASTRQQLRNTFGGDVFNLYCTREYGCIAHECAMHDGLHIDSGSLFVEITRDGRRVPAGEVGEITITDLMNYGMPFIRSRTGDLGSLNTEPCACGSPFPRLQSLDGRESEVIRRPDGSVVAGLMLTDLLLEMPSVHFAQFVQPRIDRLEVRVIATEFSAEHERQVLAEVREIVGDQLEVTVSRVADLPRNPRSGKIPEIVSLDSLQKTNQ